MLNISGFINISDSEKEFESSEDTILKGFVNNDLEKGKKFPIGTIHNGYKKVSEGVWKKVSEHKMTKEEHEKRASDMKKYAKDAENGHDKNVKLQSSEMHNKMASELDSKEYSDKDVVGDKKEKSKKEVTFEDIKKPFKIKFEKFSAGSGKWNEADVTYDQKNFTFDLVDKDGNKTNMSSKQLLEKINSGDYKMQKKSSEKKEDKPKENKPITLDTFKELAKNSKSPQELFDKIREVKNVPAKVASKFFEKYGSGGKDTPQEAVKKFFNEHNKSDSKDQEIALGDTSIKSTNTADLIKEASEKGYRKVKVEFVPAYDETRHKDIKNKELIESMKKPKVETLDVVEDSLDIVHLIKNNKDIKEIKFTK